MERPAPPAPRERLARPAPPVDPPVQLAPQVLVEALLARQALPVRRELPAQLVPRGRQAL
jgi:hypothetical protein